MMKNIKKNENSISSSSTMRSHNMILILSRVTLFRDNESSGSLKSSKTKGTSILSSAKQLATLDCGSRFSSSRRGRAGFLVTSLLLVFLWIFKRIFMSIAPTEYKGSELSAQSKLHQTPSCDSHDHCAQSEPPMAQPEANHFPNGGLAFLNDEVEKLRKV